MLRKIAILGSAVGLLVAAAPILATGGYSNHHDNKNGGTSNQNQSVAQISVSSVNSANTGDNTQNNKNKVTDSHYVLGLNLGWGGAERTIVTGNANATTNTDITANINSGNGGYQPKYSMYGKDSFKKGHGGYNQPTLSSSNKNEVKINVASVNSANTGFNSQDDTNSVDDSCGVIVGNVGVNGGSRYIQTGDANATTNTDVLVNSNVNANVSLH